MGFHRILLFLGLYNSAAGISATSYSQPQELDSSYTFDEYVLEFQKSYSKGTDEYRKRQAIFQKNMETILNHNAANGLFSFQMGVNEFADRESSEMWFGYDKGSHPAWSGDETSAVSRRLSDTDYQMDLPFEITDVSTLPAHVDWREKGVASDVKNQKNCGSCWAFAAVEALESNIAMNTGELFELSPQELVSCVSNPNHCGGGGGCSGATVDLAYGFVAQNGIALDSIFPYTAMDGVCPEKSSESITSNLRGFVNDSTAAIAGIEGYGILPSNDYAALMNAVAKHGPVTISVAADQWILYHGGVFSADTQLASAWDINHAVVAMGYGTDEETGEDYWLVRNSWGPGWGENGYIRLKRVDPQTQGDPKGDCGIDATPADGSACEEYSNGMPPPTAVEVCGTNGLLFDSVIPIGGYKQS